MRILFFALSAIPMVVLLFAPRYPPASSAEEIPDPTQSEEAEDALDDIVLMMGNQINDADWEHKTMMEIEADVNGLADALEWSHDTLDAGKRPHGYERLRKFLDFFWETKLRALGRKAEYDEYQRTKDDRFLIYSMFLKTTSELVREVNAQNWTMVSSNEVDSRVAEWMVSLVAWRERMEAIGRVKTYHRGLVDHRIHWCSQLFYADRFDSHAADCRDVWTKMHEAIIVAYKRIGSEVREAIRKSNEPDVSDVTDEL